MHTGPVISDEELAGLTAAERADVIRRIHSLTLSQFTIGRGILLARRWLPRVLAVACVVMIAWMVGLAVTLPRSYVATHWRAQWIGFDVALTVGLAMTAWSMWRRRQSAIPAALATGTLLLCDAWFDVLTASRDDLVVSLASALFAEIPLGILMVRLAVRLLQAGARITFAIPGDVAMPILRRIPLVSALEPDWES